MEKGNSVGIVSLNVNVKGLPGAVTSHYFAINDIILTYSKSYISPELAKRLYETLCKHAVAIKDVQLVSQLDKQCVSTILEKLRVMCQKLLEFSQSYQWTHDDVEHVTSTLQCQVMVLNMEKEDNAFDVVKFLKRNKEIWEDVFLSCPYKDKVSPKCVKDFNKAHKTALKLLVGPLELIQAENHSEQVSK